MCGIAGIYNFNVPIMRLLEEQAHRGPDATGFCSIQVQEKLNLELGHNRLKVICLSDLANQPLIDASEQYYLTFNGEIYNYLHIRKELEGNGIQFKTSSDSEVLLQALLYWGIGALSKINGMFAFAYFDRKAKALYLARDRFGVKPLYYYAQNSQLMFASSSRAIARYLKLKPNYAYLKKGLQYGIYEDGTQDSAYKNLYSVRAGHFIKINLLHCSQVNEFRYYNLTEAVNNLKEQDNNYTHDQLFNLVSKRLDESCKLRLQFDIPVAVTLSGGLDSATVAAIAKQSTPAIEAFCFGSPNNKDSEGNLAELLAKKHSIKTHFIEPNTKEWVNGFWETLKFQDAPFAGLSVIAQHLLYKHIKKSGYKVVLGGQGGDEAFLGYRKFQYFHLKELIKKRCWSQAAQNLCYFSQMLWSERNRLSMFWKIRAKYIQLHGQSYNIKLPSEHEILYIGESRSLQQRQIDDIIKFSIPTLLRYEDRNSMAHNIESRLPFMDYRLIELACALPTDMKLKKGYGKWVLRQKAQPLVPNKIRLARYKRGFDVSHTKNIYNALAHSIQNHISENHNLIMPFLEGIDPKTYFNATNLHAYQHRLIEMTTLFWLIEKL